MVRKSFATFFPSYSDFHFYKDPGQIPFRFSKLGYKSKIICSENKDYSQTKNFLQVDIIQKKTFLGFGYSIYYYFFKNSKKIDVLNMFHLDYWENLLAAFLYKLFNKKGFVYLKMDNCHNSGIYSWEKIFDRSIIPTSHFKFLEEKNLKNKIKKYLIKNIFIKKIDLFSVEDEESAKFYEKKYSFLKDKLITIYNGYTVDLDINQDFHLNSFEEKENLLITAGRLGTFQKNTMNLLEGFATTANQHNWKLKLAGPIDKDFVVHINNFFNKNPELKSRISFLGNLSKPALFDLYNKAKIFLLPSHFEAFSNVYSEAMYFGNAIITTPFTSLKEITLKNKIGLLIDPNKPEEIGSAILKMISNPDSLKLFGENARKFAIENLNWDKIVNKINSIINKY